MTILSFMIETININVKIEKLCLTVREQLREQTKQYEKSENDLKALQSVGQVRKLCVTSHHANVTSGHPVDGSC